MTALTLEQAAELLNASTEHVLDLVESGQVKGDEHSVDETSLVAHLVDDDHLRADAADELCALTQELGLT